MFVPRRRAGRALASPYCVRAAGTAGDLGTVLGRCTVIGRTARDAGSSHTSLTRGAGRRTRALRLRGQAIEAPLCQGRRACGVRDVHGRRRSRGRCVPMTTVPVAAACLPDPGSTAAVACTLALELRSPRARGRKGRGRASPGPRSMASAFLLNRRGRRRWASCRLLGGDAGPARQRGSPRPSCALAPRGLHPLRTCARHSVPRHRVLRHGPPGCAVEGLSPRHRMRASAGCVLRP
jgi:hypothetical protein